MHLPLATGSGLCLVSKRCFLDGFLGDDVLAVIVFDLFEDLTAIQKVSEDSSGSGGERQDGSWSET